MGQLVAVGNLKGGTGKSTIAVNLVSAMAAGGRRVVLVDADAQGTATDWHAGHRLPAAVETLPLTDGRDAHAWVARALQLKIGAERVVVDLPPQVGPGIASALLIADLLVVPVTPSGVDLRATGKVLDLLRRARAVRGGLKPLCLLVPSRVDRRTSTGRKIHATLEAFGLKVGPALRQRSAQIEAFNAGAWIGDYAPGSPGHRELRVLRDRVEELLQTLEPVPAPAADVAGADAKILAVRNAIEPASRSAAPATQG